MLNKSDLLSPEKTSAVMDYLKSTYPDATIVSVSATTGLGFETWLESIRETDRAGRHVIDLDYGRYAEAEASLDWLNLSGTLHLSDPQSGANWLQIVLDGIAEVATEHTAEIAHVKAWIDGGTESSRGHLVDAWRSRFRSVRRSSMPESRGRPASCRHGPKEPSTGRTKHSVRDSSAQPIVRSDRHRRCRCIGCGRFRPEAIRGT